MDCKRAGNISEEQKNMMFDFMASHPELRKGKFSTMFTYKKAQLLWEQLTDQLNQLNGGRRDWKSWRKTWQDLCSRAKHKKCQISKHKGKTGGGEETLEKLTTFEENVTSLLGEVPINGHPNSVESLVVNFLSTSSKSSNTNVESLESFYDTNVENDTIIEEIELLPSVVEYNNSTVPHVEHCYATSSNSTSATEIRKPLAEINSATPKAGVKRSYATQRLDHTINATDQLVTEMREKNKIKREYYEKKLKLYEREVLAREEYYRKKSLCSCGNCE